MLFTTASAFGAIHPFATLPRALPSHGAWADGYDLLLAFAIIDVQQHRHAEGFFLEFPLDGFDCENVDVFVFEI